MHLGLIVPSAVLALERHVVINPHHPAVSLIKIIEVYEFINDPRMFSNSAGALKGQKPD